MSTIFYH